MKNQVKLEVFFKGSDLAELVKSFKDIVVTINVTYPPDEPPYFEIYADGFINGAANQKKPGCPRPCP